MEQYTEKYKVPMDLFHLFMGKPQCSYVDKMYVEDKHVHREIELVYVLTGGVEIMVDKQDFTVNEGELLAISENVLHQYQSQRKDTNIIKIKFLKDWLMPAFFETEEKDALNRLYGHVFLTSAQDTIRSIVLDAVNYSTIKYSEYFYLGKIIELTAYLLANMAVIRQTKEVELFNQRYLEQAIEYMQENCYEKLTLKMLADHLGLTETYCSKYIKKNTGITFVQYLNAIRINNSQRLLLNTNYSISEIAERVGFTSVQTFNRAFKIISRGLSPREYRKLHGSGGK